MFEVRNRQKSIPAMLTKRNKFLQHEMRVLYVSISKLLWKILVLCTVFNIDCIFQTQKHRIINYSVQTAVHHTLHQSEIPCTELKSISASVG